MFELGRPDGPRPERRRWSLVFGSLRNRNYRSYFIGQAVSLPGTWMQAVAQSWLVVQLTGSGTALGLVVATQTLPLLLLTPYAGVVVDRADKRKLLAATQTSLAVLALVLGALTVTHQVRLWMVFVLAALLGIATSLDNPGRQALIVEMVGTDDLPNAVALNSVLVSAARAIGPALAGVLIVLVGVGPCFLINAGTFVAIIFALVTMNVSALHPAPPAERAAGQLAEGFRHVRRTPGVWIPLLMMAIIGTFAYEFQVVLPLIARRTFSGNADTYGFLTSALGVGAVVGGLTLAAVRTRGLPGVVASAALFGVALLGAAAAPSLWLEMSSLVAVGAFSVAFLAGGNTTVQLAADPSMRGRVMALWTVAFLGSTPIGGPIDGYVAQHGRPGRLRSAVHPRCSPRASARSRWCVLEAQGCRLELGDSLQLSTRASGTTRRAGDVQRRPSAVRTTAGTRAEPTVSRSEQP